MTVLQMKKLFLKEYDYPVHLTINGAGGDKKKITMIVWSRDGSSQ